MECTCFLFLTWFIIPGFNPFSSPLGAAIFVNLSTCSLFASSIFLLRTSLLVFLQRCFGTGIPPREDDMKLLCNEMPP
uniref:Uncharacterized protein n=1 Tax=Rhizophora mucronata TaxID=61149 RepID=A0A2P2IRC8_RHIMU